MYFYIPVQLFLKTQYLRQYPILEHTQQIPFFVLEIKCNLLRNNKQKYSAI